MHFSKPVTDLKIRLLLADDHTILRQGMAQFLGQEPDIEIVGEASDGEAAVQLAAKLQPDIVVMDLEMPKMTGLEATRRIRRDLPQVGVIALSMYEERERADAMLAAGASMYLTKTGPAQELIAAIRSCMKTRMVLARGVRRLSVQTDDAFPPLPKFGNGTSSF
jgi:DNA-binding NarL/FixJ family response regulator